MKAAYYDISTYHGGGEFAYVNGRNVRNFFGTVDFRVEDAREELFTAERTGDEKVVRKVGMYYAGQLAGAALDWHAETLEYQRQVDRRDDVLQERLYSRDFLVEGVKRILLMDRLQRLGIMETQIGYAFKLPRNALSIGQLDVRDPLDMTHKDGFMDTFVRRYGIDTPNRLYLNSVVNIINQTRTEDVQGWAVDRSFADLPNDNMAVFSSVLRVVPAEAVTEFRAFDQFRTEHQARLEA